MTRAYVSLGSNIERERHLRAAVAALAGHFGALALSPVYESEPVGFSGAPFYNLVAGFETGERPEAVAALLRAIEDRCDRVRGGPRFASRTLDLDLVLYGDLVLERGGLVLPRPEILTAAFVLRPLADLAPTLRHPVEGASIAELWARFRDGAQRLWPVDFDPRGAPRPAPAARER